MGRQIVQVIPCATELYARYGQPEGEFRSRVICLALIERQEHGITYRTVEGMDQCGGEIESVETNSNFLGYASEPLARTDRADKPCPEPATAQLPLDGGENYTSPR